MVVVVVDVVDVVVEEVVGSVVVVDVGFVVGSVVVVVVEVVVVVVVVCRFRMTANKVNETTNMIPNIINNVAIRESIYPTCVLCILCCSGY